MSLAGLGFFVDSAVLFGLLELPLGLVLQPWLSLALRTALRVRLGFLVFQFLEWLLVGLVLLLRQAPVRWVTLWVRLGSLETSLLVLQTSLTLVGLLLPVRWARL